MTMADMEQQDILDFAYALAVKVSMILPGYSLGGLKLTEQASEMIVQGSKARWSSNAAVDAKKNVVDVG